MITRRAIARFSATPVMLGAVLLLSGCRAGGGASVEKVNNELRAKVMDLEHKLGALEGRNTELAVKLEESERARTGALPKDVLEAIPRCVAIGIGSLSGYQPARRDQPAVIIVDIEPADALGRFVQIVGTLHIEVRTLPAVGSRTAESAPMTLSLGPAQLREAYRAGLLGSGYTVKLPAASLQPPCDVVIRARFDDALSGRSHSAELTRPVPAIPKDPSPR